VYFLPDLVKNQSLRPTCILKENRSRRVVDMKTSHTSKLKTLALGAAILLSQSMLAMDASYLETANRLPAAQSDETKKQETSSSEAKKQVAEDEARSAIPKDEQMERKMMQRP